MVAAATTALRPPLFLTVSLRSSAVLPGRARLDHRERHPPPSLVDFEHPDADHLTDAHHVVRIADVLIREMADVHQPAVVQADVDKGPKVDHVEHRTQQFHAGLQVLELEYALLKKWLRQVLAGIAAGPGQLLDNVGQQQPTDSQLTGERIEVEGRRSLRQGLRLLATGDILTGSAEPLQHLRGHLVALGMDPGGVERLHSPRDLQKADRLDERRLAEAGHLEELSAGGERPVLGPPFVQVAGRGLVEP